MIKQFKIILITLAVVFTQGCDNDLNELNVDPNSAVNVDPSTLLTTAQYQLYNAMAGTTLNADWGLLMVQYWAQNEYTEDSRYNQDITFFNGYWITFYASIIKELNAAKDLVAAQEVSDDIKTNRNNILNVMLAQAFISLTDGFGAIPFSEAINLDIPLPAYDSQETIYNAVLETLDIASTTFVPSANSFSSGDILYGGDVEKWKNFTNSLMLRYAMRIVDVDPATAATYINKANSSLISSNAENALFTFESSQDRSHPLYQNVAVNNRDDYCVSEYLVSKLTAMNDPRLEKFAKNASGGTIVGMPYGLSDNDATVLKPTTSRPNDAVREATSAHAAMTYAEVQFLLAEAYQRGILSGIAEDAYKSGITASLNQWGITDGTVVDNYIGANAYNAANWKESVGTQKWVAFYMDGYQAWCEWRRLDYPQLAVPATALITSIPVRLPYPLSETQNNSSNLGQITSTPAEMITKVWWDIN